MAESIVVLFILLPPKRSFNFGDNRDKCRECVVVISSSLPLPLVDFFYARENSRTFSVCEIKACHFNFLFMWHSQNMSVIPFFRISAFFHPFRPLVNVIRQTKSSEKAATSVVKLDLPTINFTPRQDDFFL